MGAPLAAQARDSAATPRVSVVLFAEASAREVTFATQPQLHVRLLGALDSVHVLERRNLPSPIVAGRTYKDVYVAVEIFGRVNADCITKNITGNGPKLDCASLEVRGASGAAPARLAAGTAAARIDGGDSEAYVLAEKAGGYSMFCEWDSPLAVTRGSETRTASPRQCVIAKPDEPLYLADAHQDRLAALEDSCAPANFAALGPHFPAIAARDVAAGPAPFSVSPAELPGLERQACEDPGAACPTIRIDEEPPGGGGFPGENP
jgi:hypothetical protein